MSVYRLKGEFPTEQPITGLPLVFFWLAGILGGWAIVLGIVYVVWKLV